MIKSPSISSTTTTTESGSPLAIISTRKTRTPRKRPNQTYNEAAALLATAYPKIFPSTTTDNNNFTKPSFSFEPTSDLLVDTTSAAGLLLHRPNCSGPNSPSDKCGELDFDIILGGEVLGEGIDCIMGDFSMGIEKMGGGFCYGYPVGLGFEIGVRKEMRAIRNGDEEGDWWRFPTPTVDDDDDDEFVVPRLSADLLLKLNHDAVLEAWSNKASPFSDDVQIELLGGMREASLLRYEAKSPFLQKNQIPRRFMRTQNSNSSDD